MDQKIYLDYNASAPIRDEAVAVMVNAMAQAHNASAVHGFGRVGRKLIEAARSDVAALVGARADQVIFNSGATEGNNTVLRHFADERVLVSALEHPAVLEAVEHVERVAVTRTGVVDLDALEGMLKAGGVGLVSVMLVNNETGIVQPVAEAAALAHRYGALFHCDAVQAAGRMRVDIAALGVDFMTISAHKLGGPQGVGALVLGLCGVTPVLLHGGGQEKSARAGTENVAGIAGFGEAARIALAELDDYETVQSEMHLNMRAVLAGLDGVNVYGQEHMRVANTTLFSMDGMSSETALMALDLDGIAVSNGSACSSGRVEPSHVLKAMGVTDSAAKGALRVSTGWASTQNDVDRFMESWHIFHERMKGRRDA